MMNRDEAQASAWAESPERTIAPDAKVYRGREAVETSAALLDEYTRDDPETAALVAKARRDAAGGRPSLSPQKKGPSPVWSLRVPADLDSAVRERAEREGVRLADLLRRIAAEYVQKAS